MLKDLICIGCGSEFKNNYKHDRYCSNECRTKIYTEKAGREAWQKELSSATVGAVSEMMVALYLMKKGYAVFRALSPSCFCDLIAIKDSKILKIEARTGYKHENGSYYYPRTTHGEIDYFGIYVPSFNHVTFFDLDRNEIEL